MFGRVSRKRKEIELRCPACGAGQVEPVLAISSFCRSCGVHFQIENGEAVLPSGTPVSGIVPVWEESPGSKDAGDSPAEPVMSLGAEAQILEKAEDPGRGVGQTWMEQAREKSQAEKRTARRGKKSGKQGGKRSKGKRKNRGAGKAGTAEKAGEKDKTEIKSEGDSRLTGLGSSAQPAESLKQGNISAMLGGAMEKIAEASGGDDNRGFQPKMPATFVPAEKKKGHGPAMRPIRCFECNHLQQVSAAATSTQCGRCSVYISLVDHDIHSVWSQNIRTRGNVRVRRKGSVMGCDIACHDLEVDGGFSASVDCSGEAVFRHSARIMGNMHCRHLVVEKKCEVVFPQGVVAESVDVYGTIVGNIICAGTIRIYKRGKVEGDAIARAVDLRDGGVLSGRMSIRPNLDITLPEKKGYLSESS